MPTRMYSPRSTSRSSKTKTTTAPKPDRFLWSGANRRGFAECEGHSRALYSSVLVTVLCALLGFSYAIQLNNTTSTYETMSEDELTKLISETSTQVQKLEQRKSELSNQLDSLKDTADKNEKAAEIARQNAESNGILSGRYQYPAKAWSSVFPKDQSEILTRRFYSPYLRNYAIAARKSLKSTIFA